MIPNNFIIAIICLSLQNSISWGDNVLESSKIERAHIALLTHRFHSLLGKMRENDGTKTQAETMEWYRKVIAKEVFYEWALVYGPWKERGLSAEFIRLSDKLLRSVVKDASIIFPISDPLGANQTLSAWRGEVSIKDFIKSDELGPGLPIIMEFTRQKYDKMISDFNAYIDSGERR